MEGSKGVTHRRIAALARLLLRLRLPILLAGMVSAIWFIRVLIDTSAPSAEALLPLTLTLWALLALGAAHTLTQPPEPILPGDRFGRRLKKRLIGITYVSIVLITLVLVLMTLFLSWRAWQLS